MVSAFLFIILLLINPFFVLAYTAVLIAFLIPWEYLGLWIASVIAAWTLVLFPLNRPDPGHFDFLAEIIISGVNLVLLAGIAVVIIIRLLKKHNYKKEQTKIKSSQLLSFLVYGILSACFSYLFFTDFWHDYQPAWQAYGIMLARAILAIVSCLLFQKYSYKHRDFYYRNLYWLPFLFPKQNYK